MDFVSKFLTAMVNSGIVPKNSKEITTTDTFRRLQSSADKAGKRSISYWLKTELDFAYGYARDFKTGAELRFNSAKDDQNMTRADMTRIKAMMKARQAEQDARIAERHAKIADRAKVKWAQCGKSGSTPYLDAKGIPALLSCGIYGTDQLFVPIYEPQKSGGLDLVSWQIIYADGTKHFPFGGKKTGCYHIIGQIDPTKTIIICEGYATGASIHIALGYGVVVAFDAGNLLPVAKAIRKQYNAPIIIAADNDESQTGQKAAFKAQKSVSDTSIIIPDTIGADFNDLSPEAIKMAFGVGGDSGEDAPRVSQSLETAPAIHSEHDWMASIISDDKGRVVATSLQNAIMYLIYHQDFKGVFAYDEFRQGIVMTRCPPWEYPETFKAGNLTDIAVTQAAATLERYGITSTIDKTAKAIQVAASENKFHSAREYLAKLEWDGVSRLEGFLQGIGCTEESPEYLAFIFKKWMTASVKRIFEPACKFDHVLILESQQQGLYKSAMLKELVTFEGETYHTDAISIADIKSQYTPLKMQGVMVVELAELSGFSKQDDESIKNWITQQIDEVRLPYDRSISKFPRQFVFAATTNNYNYLKDPSGNRRFWPVTIMREIDIEEIRTIKNQIWAEAVHWYKQKLYIGPTPEENELAEIERNKRLSSDAWEDIVMRIVQSLDVDEFKIPDILEKMDLRMTEKNDLSVKRISGILRMNGFDNSSRWDKRISKTVRYWSKA